MKFLRLCGCLCLLSLVAGCTVVGSAHPLFTGKESAEDAPIAGVWEREGQDKGVREVTVESKGNGEYEVSFRDDSDGPGKNPLYEFNATIRRVANHLLYDASFHKLIAKDVEVTEDDLLAFPMHFVGVIRLDGDTAVLQPLNGDWLKDGLGKEKFRAPHEAEGDYILLLAPAPELQSFMLNHIEDQQAFPAVKFHRQKGRAAEDTSQPNAARPGSTKFSLRKPPPRLR